MSDETVPKNENNSDSDSEENNRQPARSIALDLVDDCVHNVEANRLGSQTPSGVASVHEFSGSNTTKREENPFSFKHFLRDSPNSNRNYQSLGARPKVYRENRSRNVTPPESPQRPAQSTRKIGEFPSALPDFVQDHLVIEQCFLGNKSNSSPTFDLDLPDFAQQEDQRTHNGPSVSRSNSAEEPTIGTIPLDLPGLSMGNAFPLDLPVSANLPMGEPRNIQSTEVGNSKSLPDFLTDGPVRTTTAPATPSPSATIFNLAGASSEESRCRYCRQVQDPVGTRQRDMLIEEEVERNLRRTAENTVARLRQELKALKAQVRQLQAENQALRQGDGGVAGGGGDPPLALQAQRLAQELRAAASTAEHSLRSLLTGVDNLRTMASTLENFHRIEERHSDRFSRFDDDRAGPAL